jgi:CubicO group peptidase (beta-lactamase class C family)
MRAMSPPGSHPALQALVEAECVALDVPGAQWALIDRGELVHEGVAGMADERQPVTPATLFQACSISKPVAVLAMLRLVEQGLLDLDQDVNERLVSWRVRPLAGWQPMVTLRQLASHSAGLTTSGFPGYRRGDALPTTVEILDGTGPANTFAVRVDTVPGVQFRYSGGGTMVLQQVLEDVTGTPFGELARELVLRPLGMGDSDYAQPLPASRRERSATAHDDAGRPVDGRWHTYPELAAAGLWTTAGDLARFAVGVQRAYAGAEGAVLGRALMREALIPQVEAAQRIGGLTHLGLGLFLGGTGADSRFGHSGGNEGFRCHLLAYRETGQGAVVMTNGDNGAWLVERALARIAAEYGWPAYPTEVSERDLPGPDRLGELEGTYRLGERTTMSVTPDGGRLLVTFSGQAPMPFVPQSPDSFAAWPADAGLRVDRSTRPPTLLFTQNDAEIACVRLTAPPGRLHTGADPPGHQPVTPSRRRDETIPRRATSQESP